MLPFLIAAAAFAPAPATSAGANETENGILCAMKCIGTGAAATSACALCLAAEGFSGAVCRRVLALSPPALLPAPSALTLSATTPVGTPLGVEACVYGALCERLDFPTSLCSPFIALCKFCAW